MGSCILFAKNNSQTPFRILAIRGIFWRNWRSIGKSVLIRRKNRRKNLKSKWSNLNIKFLSPPTPLNSSISICRQIKRNNSLYANVSGSPLAFDALSRYSRNFMMNFSTCMQMTFEATVQCNRCIVHGKRIVLLNVRNNGNGARTLFSISCEQNNTNELFKLFRHELQQCACMHLNGIS